jgi:tRNA-modifying protein YgfZ
MPRTALWDRAVIRVKGEAAATFLNGLITCSMVPVQTGQGAFGALLSPQGKVLFDFFLLKSQEADTILLDCDKDQASALIERLIFYRLRAKITFALDDKALVIAGWGDEPAPSGVIKDPRHPDLGWRLISDQATSTYERDRLEEYHAHRICLGVPEGGKDFTFGEVFPHDVMMDVLNGVDFTKGCYVGQEVVSRVQHRGTARTRMVIVDYKQEPTPRQGSEILAEGRVLGLTGRPIGQKGLAMLRIDKLKKALEQGQPLTAQGRVLKVREI